MGEFISTAFHLLYETVRQFWWAFFLGWWVFWGVKAHRAKSWAALKVPSIITAIGLVVALASTMQVYEAVNDPGNFSVQLDPCSSWDHPDEQADCYGDDEDALRHFASLAVFTEGENRDIHFLKTYVNVFGDTVSYVQIVLLWLMLPLFFLLRPKKPGPKKEKRDIIHV